MDTETMIRELERVEENHKDDRVFTGQLNIAEMAHDVKNRLEELKPYEDTDLTPEQIRELKERDTEKSVCHYHEEEKFRAYCPTCKRYLGIDFKEGYRGPENTFCPGCGQRVKWED